MATETAVVPESAPDLVAQLRGSLLRRAEEYAKLTNAGITTVSEKCSGDWEFLKRVEAGNFTVRSYEKAMGWFDENWPQVVS